MRTLIIIFSFFLVSVSAIGQNNFDPKVIVLLPRTVEIENGLEKEIEFYEKYGISYQKNYLIEKRDSLLSAVRKNDSISLNQKEHQKNQIDFASELNFINNIVWNYTESFQNILNLDFKSPLVIVDTKKSFSDLLLMQEYSLTNNADYIVNIDSLIITKHKKDILVKPIFTIYYQKENRIIEIDPFGYDQYNKSYLTVNKKTLNIYFDDIDERTEILRIIEKNGDSTRREELKQQKILEEKRINILDSLFQFGKANDKLIGFNRDTILNTPLSGLYTTIHSTSKNRCLAFFGIKKKWDYEGFGGVNDEIIVIYCKKVEDYWRAEYQQHGVIKINKLTQEENVKAAFMNLIEMDFFKENSIELNNEFWSKELFKKSNQKFK